MESFLNAAFVVLVLVGTVGMFLSGFLNGANRRP
jgi:hypothetical protein